MDDDLYEALFWLFAPWPVVVVVLIALVVLVVLGVIPLSDLI